MKIGDQVFRAVLDTGATLSIVARRLLKTFNKTKTVAIRVAFDIVIGTDFLRRNPQVKMLSLQRPYSLHCDFGSGLFSVPLELSGLKESGLRYASKSLSY